MSAPAAATTVFTFVPAQCIACAAYGEACGLPHGEVCEHFNLCGGCS